MKIVLLIALCIACPAQAIFNHSRAARLMQQGKYEQAKSLMQQLVTNNPENAEILYDAGVASYKTNDFQQAAAYFKKVTELPKVPDNLKGNAYYNAGNTAVELNQLPEALALYESALKINPQDHRAQHNIEKVKEMMKEQEKKQQEQQQNKDQKKDGEKKDSEQKQKQQQDNKSSKEQKEDQQKGQQESNEQRDQQQQEKNEEKQNRQKGNENNNAQNGQQEGIERDQQNDAQQKKQNGEQQKHGEKSELEKNKQSMNGSQNKDKEDKTQGACSAQASPNKKLEGWLAQLLEDQEKKDAQANKALMQSAVSDDFAGENGQNNW